MIIDFFLFKNKLNQDEDSYVRKTAAICVAKLYDVAPELLEEQGFIKMLENLYKNYKL